MRYLTCYTPGNGRIDISNTWLGAEKIYYNGDLMSQQTSIFGSTHEFRVSENGEPVIYRIVVEIKWPFRIGFDIFRNGLPLVLS